jgi:hypothetical protein
VNIISCLFLGLINILKIRNAVWMEGSGLQLVETSTISEMQLHVAPLR